MFAAGTRARQQRAKSAGNFGRALIVDRRLALLPTEVVTRKWYLAVRPNTQMRPIAHPLSERPHGPHGDFRASRTE